MERVTNVEGREEVGLDITKIYYTHFKELKINNVYLSSLVSDEQFFSLGFLLSLICTYKHRV